MFAHHRPEMFFPIRGASAGNVVNSKANNVAPIDMIYTLKTTLTPRTIDVRNKLRALPLIKKWNNIIKKTRSLASSSESFKLEFWPENENYPQT